MARIPVHRRRVLPDPRSGGRPCVPGVHGSAGAALSFEGFLANLYSRTMSDRTLRPLVLTTLTAVAAAALVAGCAGTSSTPASSPAPSSPGPSPSSSAASHWGYEGADGPDHWGELPGAKECGIGKQQSPVNLAGAQQAALPPVEISYRPSRLAVTNTGHSMQAVYDAGSFATIDGERYELKQFHHHAPSEHTVNGAHSPAELHFVHQNAAGQLAVLGVLVTKGAANPVLQEFLDAAPADKGATKAPGGETIDAAALLPTGHDSYRYSGSLTTPPCSEGVSWVMFSTPITASAEQLATFAGLSGANNRPVQGLDGRTLETDAASAPAVSGTP